MFWARAGRCRPARLPQLGPAAVATLAASFSLVGASK